MLRAGLAIVILVLCSSYKSYPTISKLTALKILTIVLTILTSFMILSLLFGVLPAYLGSTSEVYDGLASFVYGVTGVYMCVMIAVCVLACVQGYRAVKNGFLESAAYQEQQRKTNMFFGQFTQGSNRQYNCQQGFTTEHTSWQCRSCGKYNNPAHNFCIYCGHPKQ